MADADTYEPKTPEGYRAVEEYAALCHAMQTGVAAEEAIGSDATTGKHLRVGVNSAMCDHAALVRLLVERGIITPDDYVIAVRDEMAREVERYESRLGPGAKLA